MTQLLGRDAQFGIDLIDDGSSPPGALVVHARNFFLAAGLWVFFENDDLGVLSAQLYHGTDFGMQFFDGKGDGVHLLHEFGADQRRNAPASTAGNEDAE